LFTRAEQVAGVELRANERNGFAALLSGAADLAREADRTFERRFLALLFAAASDPADAVDTSLIADGGAFPTGRGRGETADNAVIVGPHIGNHIRSHVHSRVGNVGGACVAQDDIDLDIGVKIDARIRQRSVGRVQGVVRVPADIDAGVTRARNVGNGPIGA
jgi:hypothetical protein